MTEQEWLEGTDSTPMLKAMRDNASQRKDGQKDRVNYSIKAQSFCPLRGQE